MNGRLYLSTRDCADILEVTPAFIRGEIRDGRLHAEVLPRTVQQGRRFARAFTRIPIASFRIYCTAYWPSALTRIPPAA